MDCDGLPVLDTRKVLLNHLKAKIQSTKCIAYSDEVLDEIAKELTNKEIICLLENEEKLVDKIVSSKLYQIAEKQTIGDALFVAVSRINTELCAQLTGMLLELDIETIKKLVNDPQALKQAVLKAKQEYMKYTKGDVKEIFGEELYELVIDRYHDENLASQLTGMLLELDVDTLQRLISNKTELDERLETAYSVLNVICKSD